MQQNGAGADPGAWKAGRGEIRRHIHLGGLFAVLVFLVAVSLLVWSRVEAGRQAEALADHCATPADPEKRYSFKLACLQQAER